MRRSRKPLSVVRRIEGSNPSPSAYASRCALLVLRSAVDRPKPALATPHPDLVVGPGIRGSTPAQSWQTEAEDLLHRNNVDRADVGRGREQLVRDLAERARDLSVDVRLASIFGFERVEDPVRVLVELERIPGDRSTFLRGNVTATAKKGRKIIAFPSLGLEPGEDSERDRHDEPPYVGAGSPSSIDRRGTACRSSVMRRRASLTQLGTVLALTIALDDYPFVPLLFGPSPVHPLERLSKALGGRVEIWAKREDCNSGLAYGGNKVRKLEYLAADALATGCDTLVSIGGVQSNHTRQVAAVAARLGLKCVLVQEHWVEWPDVVYDKVGNILLSRIMGADV